MKRYVLLVGGTGARLADALIVAASAGALPAEKLNVLLADTDRRGVQGASLVSAKMADYARIYQAVETKEGPFRTEVAFAMPNTMEDIDTAEVECLMTKGEMEELIRELDRLGKKFPDRS